jgi:FkbM family methyltransferase
MLIDFKYLVKKYNMNIKRILHVGAHFCEERDAYNSCGIQDQDIYWVEGNEDIVQNMLRDHPQWNIYPELISDKDGQNVDFIIMNNKECSSILELDECKREHPYIVEVSRRKRQTCRLDTVIARRNIPPVDFMNIDIQGAELLALRGMGRYLDHVSYIYTEVNTKHIYKDCALIGELDSFLSEHGFVRKETSMTPHGWGDALYVRERRPIEPVLVFECPPNSCGGLGDRVVGLVSAILMAKVTHRKLLIDFQEPPVTDHLWTVSCPYAPHASQLSSSVSFKLDTVDDRFKYNHELSTLDLNEWWNHAPVVRLHCNQEIASFVYQNPHYLHLKDRFAQDVADVYAQLFTTYLVPRPAMKINWTINKQLIGLQIRCGDVSMGCGDVQFISSEHLRNVIVPMLKYNISKLWNPTNYAIFVTTDSDECYSLLMTHFKDYVVLRNVGPTDHFERQGNPQGTDKTLRDLLMLSKTNVVVISAHSNFGRIAAMINPTDQVYTFGTDGIWNGKIQDKTRLTTKHQTSIHSIDI